MNRFRLLTLSLLAAGVCTETFGVTKKNIDFVVGVDGDFKAAMSAAAAANPSETNRFVIFFPEGEYDLTNLTADTHGKTSFSTSYVSFIGETRDKAIIANVTDTEGISLTATLYFPKNNGIYMQDLTIQNKSSFVGTSAARQVTIQQNGDKYIFKNVRLLSGQDTYYTKGTGRTYWEGGEIQGTVDFICGDGNVFFEGTNLVMTRNGGYITAASTTTDWGYVFNNTTINVSNSSYNGTFYLGRSWNHAKTVFLNTTMYAQPKAEGWGPDMNSAPTVYGEYNSKDGNGNAVNTSSRKTYFNGNKDASSATTLKTVWSASDAANYTLANVLGGTDGWEPNKLTEQIAATAISQEKTAITWADNDNARYWAVFVNGKYHSNVIVNSISTENIDVGSKVTVRGANSMGGLGEASNEVTVAAYVAVVTPETDTTAFVTPTFPQDSVLSDGPSSTLTNDTLVLIPFEPDSSSTKQDSSFIGIRKDLQTVKGFAFVPSATIQVFSMQGKLVRTIKGTEFAASANEASATLNSVRQSLQGKLPAGSYLVRTVGPRAGSSRRYQAVIRLE